MPLGANTPRPQTQFGTVGILGPDGTIITPADFLLQREIRNTIFDKYEEDTMFDWLIQTGRYEQSANTEYHWFEHEPLLRIATIESKGAQTGAGVALTVTLEEADHLFGATATTGTRSPFQPNDIVLVKTATGDIAAQVTAVNKSAAGAHVLTLAPVDDAVDLGTATAAADTIQFVTSGHGDGTGQPESMFRVPVKYDNKMQIFKQKFAVTGGDMANKSEVVIKGQPYYYHQGVIDADRYMRLKIDYQILLGPKGSKPDATDATATAFYTESIDAAIEARGNKYTAGQDGITLAELADMTEIMRQEDNPVENIIACSQAFSNGTDDEIRTLLDQGAIVYNSWGNGNSGLNAVDFGFKSFRYGDFVFHKRALKAFDYKGATAGAYNDWGLMFPADSLASGTTSKMSLKTKSSDRNSRIMRYHVKDRFEIDGVDRFEYDMLTELGTQIACVNQYWKITQ